MRIVSFLATFISVIIIVRLAGHILEKLIKIVLLGWLNRLAGVVFAWVKWNILLAVVMYILHLIESYISFLPMCDLEASSFYPIVLKFGEWLVPYLPFLK